MNKSLIAESGYFSVAGGYRFLSDIDDSEVSGIVIVVSSVSAKLNGYDTGELDG